MQNSAIEKTQQALTSKRIGPKKMVKDDNCGPYQTPATSEIYPELIQNSHWLNHPYTAWKSPGQRLKLFVNQRIFDRLACQGLRQMFQESERIVCHSSNLRSTKTRKTRSRTKLRIRTKCTRKYQVQLLWQPSTKNCSRLVMLPSWACENLYDFPL